MNVLVTNKQEELLSNLTVEIIKTLRGEYDVEELVGQFNNFFFGRMILDVTAIKDYKNIINYQKISIALPVDKIILLLPREMGMEDPSFVPKLISMGFYNFGTNLREINYLIEHLNTYKDVAHLHRLDLLMNPNAASQTQMGTTEEESIIEKPVVRVIGIKNVTASAGATTLAYLMKRELEKLHNVSALAIEVNKRDFSYFNDATLISINKNELVNTITSASNYRAIIVDLNDADADACDDVLYLVEPSILKLNKLLRLDDKTFDKLVDKKIVLNKTFVSGGNIDTFEFETGIKVFHVVRPLDDRSSKPMLEELLEKLGFINE